MTLEQRLDVIDAKLNMIASQICEPDPESLWSAEQIARASGYNTQDVSRKMRQAETKGALQRVMQSVYHIRYKDIKHLGLKRFDFHKLK